ncbi:MAG: hypothetical protein AAB790_02655 [Patescibacteria group bacterium]
MNWTYLKTFTLLLTLALIFGGGYIVYRYASADQQLLSWWNGGDALPVVCTLAEYRIDSSITMTMYLKGRLMRSDWEQYEPEFHNRFHSVRLGAEIFTWGDGKDIGVKVTFTEFTHEGPMTKADMEGADCRPWWNSDDSIFDVPYDVTFEALGA